MKVTIQNVSKKFPSVIALDDINVDIESGEFFVLLGPTGCGKTTLLRCIAGLEKLTKGVILFDDKNIKNIPIYKRPCTMVFQDYNLFPHLTVEKNVIYGVRAAEYKHAHIFKKLLLILSGFSPLKGKTIQNQIDKILNMLRLSSFRKRKPAELSGGQQQRVAIARALMIEPKLLLLDEPLSALDKKFRLEIREKLRDLLKYMGITTIYVTHDQEEALAIADRVALMKEGQIVEVGTPVDVYTTPQQEFTADFFGIKNIFKANFIYENNIPFILLSNGMKLRTSHNGIPNGAEIKIMLRPEAINIVKCNSQNNFQQKGNNSFKGKIIKKINLGATVKFIISVNKVNITVITFLQGTNESLLESDWVRFTIPETNIHILKSDGNSFKINEKVFGIQF